MKKYAVLCGNSQFPAEADKNKLPDLACPEKDVDGLAKVLSSEQGEFDVLSLKNKPSYQVLHELQRTVNKTQQDDLLLLYYSGHGKPNKSGILYLTSFDTVVTELEATAIPIPRIYDILSTGKCKKIVIILDCCYSGAAGQGHKGDLDAQLQQLNNSRGTYLVTASTGMQVAHESATEGLSLFTKHLIAGLETGDADKHGDGLVDMDELYDYVHHKVKTENPNQEPTQHVTDKRGDLIIAKSGRDSRKERAEKIRLLLLKLERQDEAVAEIKSEALLIARMPHFQLSGMQLQKDELLSKLLNQEITFFYFIRKWDIENPRKHPKPHNSKKFASLIIAGISVTAALFVVFIWFMSNLAKKQGVVVAPSPENNIAKNLSSSKITNTNQQKEHIGNFIIQDGIATDTQTDLMWLRFAYGQTWQNATTTGLAESVIWANTSNDAKDFNEKGGYGGYSDWRLPTINELRTLINRNKGKQGNCIDTDVFPNNDIFDWTDKKPMYWSSSTEPESPNNAYFVDFRDCGYYFINKDNLEVKLAVRFVRVEKPSR